MKINLNSVKMPNNFLNIYQQKTSNQFNAIAELQKPGDFFVAGRYGKADGLFSRLDAGGETRWSLRYALQEGHCWFDTVVECDNGDFLLYGPQFMKSNRSRSLVVRVRRDGTVIWAKTYHSRQTYSSCRLVKSLKDTYFLVSRQQAGAGVRNIEVIKINGGGQLLGAVRIGGKVDHLATRAIAYRDGIVLYGSADRGGNREGLILALDGALNSVWGSLVGAIIYDHIESLIHLGADDFAVAAVTGNQRDTYFYTFNPGAGSFGIRQYNLVAGRDEGYKKLIRVGKFFYLLGNREGDDFSFLTKLDSNYRILWHKRLNPKAGYQFRDILHQNELPEELRLAGRLFPEKQDDALLMRSGLEWNSCVTLRLKDPEEVNKKLMIRKWSPPITGLEVAVIEHEIRLQKIPPRKKELCPSPTGPGDQPDMGEGAGIQSAYIYLQAAGSDGSDDSARGFHLRWDLLRSLGEQHLPKGNLAGPDGPYSSSNGFNRNDDFVRIYRAAFQPEHITSVPLRHGPDAVFETGDDRLWYFKGLTPVADLPENMTNAYLRFLDISQYDSLRTLYDPFTEAMELLGAYTGVIEAWTDQKLFFYAEFTTAGTPGAAGQGVFRLETLSLPDPLDESSRQLTCRKHLTGLTGDVDRPQVICENIEKIRFDYSGGIVPDYINFITYEDYLLGAGLDENFWTLLGAFSLSEDTAEVFDRLEDTDKFTVHNQWRKYNEPGANGEFRVNINNYRDKWEAPDDGLHDAVVEYLNLSQTDPQATALLPNDDDITNSSALEISYLEMLNFVAVDFHVARMLGLGHIDPHGEETPDSAPFVFLMEYVTEAQLEAEPPVLVRHYYMTPPLTMLDYKSPPAPVLDPVEYGLFLDNKTGNPTAITDAAGYAPYADIRFVNLHRQTFRHEFPMEVFFQTEDTFCLCEETVPVAFGLEYAEGAPGSGAYVRPELPHDPEYLDPGGLPEVIPIVETGENPVYVHQETQEGVHHYALYSINWFSRVSPLSNEVATDQTQFPKRPTLLPPLNLTVQLIQPESTLLFTSSAEQTRLSNLSGTDKTLVRATFDWNYVHNQAYQFADRIQFFFRTAEPATVSGAIRTGPGSIAVNSLTHRVEVKTTSYQITSTNPAQTVQPNITSAEKGKFIGAGFVAGGEAFVVEDIITSASGDDPTFVLKQNRTTHLQDPDGSNIFCLTETWSSPAEGAQFFLVENLNDPASWDQLLSKEVELAAFTPLHTETVTYEDGQTQELQTGGLTDTATITHIYDPDPSATPDTPTGVYTIELDNEQLPALSDPDVDFYQGLVRIPVYGGSAMKELRIWEIDTGGATLRLTVYDASYATDAIIPSTPAGQSGITVNVHPSYRIYFEADGNLNEANTLPALHQGRRQTFMAARSKDSAENCTSYLSPPVVLLAREIRPPVPPGQPLGPVFATRPNFYDKASYTFDTEVDEPYSLILYRASDRRILDQLYQPETVRQIESDLARLTEYDARFNANRWNDLVNVVTDGEGLFPQYTSEGFRFPIPDNPDYIIPHPDPTVVIKPFENNSNPADASTIPPGDSQIVPGASQTMAEVVKDAIDGAFTPLTEMPLVFAQLAQDTLQTSARPPRLRDDNGQRLLPTDPAFNPWPMAVRFEQNGDGNPLLEGDAGYGDAGNTRYVRFTDYTLDGNSSNQYFYFGVELSNTMEVSDRSDISGPVLLLPANPPEAPVINGINVQLKDAFNGIEPAVKLTINPYLPSVGIKYIKLFRTLLPEDSLSIRTMREAGVFTSIERIEDQFIDLGFVPYGQPIFYRIVVFREILNEQGEPELIPSKPSKRVLTNVVDTINPPAPELQRNSSPLSVSSPLEYRQVTLEWEPTAYNATYHLYKMDERGTWVKIHSVASNDALIQVPLADTTWGSDVLPKEDGDGNTLYHRFKVKVINSSGLSSREERVLVV